MLTFKGPSLQAVINDANAQNTDILLVKNHGVYPMARTGERNEHDGAVHVCCAEGLNPATDRFDDCCAGARIECGGDDFAETLDRRLDVFQDALQGGKVLAIELTENNIQMKLTDEPAPRRARGS
ncbi:MAG: hypothetical protein BWZ07_01372 [Alphaproteobacteria bacterium ADurb.BinA280]|jgi:hypothetical protein|nr:MAG: hypothetical protein BWZ07_01372 [Alphaproteobacteria bacterium ADurb.BinA280]